MNDASSLSRQAACDTSVDSDAVGSVSCSLKNQGLDVLDFAESIEAIEKSLVIHM